MQAGDVAASDQGLGAMSDDLAESVPYDNAAGILRKKLYDQNLSDWSARYRKNKQNLDTLVKDCELLRIDVSKAQKEVDKREESFRQLEDQYDNKILRKNQNVKAAYEAALQRKSDLGVQISENRKHKSGLLRDKKSLTNDYQRKHAEWMRMSEVNDKHQVQLENLTQQLGQLTQDRRRMEKELDEVQHNLRSHTELASEVTSEISTVQDGIKDSMNLHMGANERMNTSQSSIGDQAPGAANTPGGGDM